MREASVEIPIIAHQAVHANLKTRVDICPIFEIQRVNWCLACLQNTWKFQGVARKYNKQPVRANFFGTTMYLVIFTK